MTEISIFIKHESSKFNESTYERIFYIKSQKVLLSDI